MLLPAAELPQEERLRAAFNCLQASFCFPPRWQSLYPSRHTAHLAKTLLNTFLSMCRNRLVRKDSMCFYNFQLPLNQQEQAHVISLGFKGCRCTSLLFYKLPLYFSSQAIVGLNSLTISHWGAVRVNALNYKALTTERCKQFRQSSSCYIISLSSVAWHGFCFLWCFSLFSSNYYVLMPSFPVPSEAALPIPTSGQGHLPNANTQFWFSSFF